MSWSKSAAGLAAVVLAAVAGWQREVKANDESFGSSAEVIDGHQAQVAIAGAVITEAVKAAPEGATFTVSAWGHAPGGTTGISFSVSAPDAPASFVDVAAPEPAPTT